MHLNFDYIKSKSIIFYYSNKLSVKLIIADQLIKWFVVQFLKGQPGFMSSPLSVLDIVYVWNYGISFGFFRNYYQYSNIAFGFINSFIILYLWYLLVNCRSYTNFLGYSCVVGGAIGNLLDRIFRGAVFDFIHFHYQDYGFPVFNLADAFISIGVAMLMYEYLQPKKFIAEKLNRFYDKRKSNTEI